MCSTVRSRNETKKGQKGGGEKHGTAHQHSVLVAHIGTPCLTVHSRTSCLTAHAGTSCLIACATLPPPFPLLTPSLRLDVPASLQRPWGGGLGGGEWCGKKKSVIWAASLTARAKIKEWWVGDRGDEVNSGEDERVLSCTFLHVFILRNLEGNMVDYL